MKVENETRSHTPDAGETPIDTGSSPAAPPSRTPKPRPGAHSNHVAHHSGADSGVQSTGGAERPESKTLAERIREEVEQRLAADPAYAEKKKEVEDLERFFSDFALVEPNALLGGDGKLTLADLKAVVDDPLRPNNVREAAQRLLDNPRLWAKCSANGQLLSNVEISALIDKSKAELALMRKEVETQVREDLGAPPKTSADSAAANASGSSSSGSPAAGAGTDPKLSPAEQSIRDEIGKAAPKPDPSKMGGLEGANENANNLLGWAEGEMDRLNALLAKTDNPATQKQIENKMNQLTRRMQSITAMITQLATMMSNISKMYSDIAMNSVRNMK